MPTIANVDNRIEVTSTTNISLIMDPTNLVFVQRVLPLSTTILVHFEGSSI